MTLIKKSTAVFSAVIKTNNNPTCQLMDYFSSWNKLKRAVVWYMKLKDILRALCVKRKQMQSNVIPQLWTRTQSKMLDNEMKAFKSKLGGQRISLDDLMRAEKAIIGFCQHQRYPKEITKLESNKCTGKGLSRMSTIYRLDPVLEDGVLRVGGRLSKAAMPDEAKCPMILSFISPHSSFGTYMSSLDIVEEIMFSLSSEKGTGSSMPTLQLAKLYLSA